MFLSPSFECKTDMIDGVLVSEMSRFELVSMAVKSAPVSEV